MVMEMLQRSVKATAKAKVKVKVRQEDLGLAQPMVLETAWRQAVVENWLSNLRKLPAP